MHSNLQAKQSIEGVKLTNLSDAVLLLEKHFFQLKSQNDIKNPQCQRVFNLMNKLATYNERRAKLKRMLERTDLLNKISGKENWEEFSYHVDEMEDNFLQQISTEDLMTSDFRSIKSTLQIMDGLIKYKVRYYNNHILDLDLFYKEITEEDLTIDIDLNDPKNYNFRLYLKNTKAGAKFKRIFIDDFGLEDIFSFNNKNSADAIFGNDNQKVVEKLEKKFTLENRIKKDNVVEENSNKSSSSDELVNTIDPLINSNSLNNNTDLSSNVTQDILRSSGVCSGDPFNDSNTLANNNSINIDNTGSQIKSEMTIDNDKPLTAVEKHNRNILHCDIAPGSVDYFDQYYKKDKIDKVVDPPWKFQKRW